MDDRLDPGPDNPLAFAMRGARSVDEEKRRGAICAWHAILSAARESRLLIVDCPSGCPGCERLEEHAEHDGNGQKQRNERRGVHNW